MSQTLALLSLLIAQAHSEPLSTPAEREPLKQVVYPVADLVVPIPNYRPNMDVEPLPGPKTFEEADRKQSQPAPLFIPRKKTGIATNTTEGELIQLITATVAPATWKEAGGAGTLQYFPLGMALVVNQAPAVQQEVRALLTTLRRSQGQVAVSVFIVSATPRILDRACKILNLPRILDQDQGEAKADKWTIRPEGERWTSFVTQEQVHHLLSVLNNDRRTTVVQAPKVTMFSGQIVPLWVTDQVIHTTSMVVENDGDSILFKPGQTQFTTGFRFALNPVVSEDRRTVRLKINGYWCQPARSPEVVAVTDSTFSMCVHKPRFSQIRLNQDVCLPDGHAVVYHAGRVEDRQILFLVTPRLLVNEAAEQPVLDPLPAWLLEHNESLR